MNMKEQYKVFEFVFRYYMLAQDCKITGKISLSNLEEGCDFLRIKSYVSVKDDKGNDCVYDMAKASRAAHNKVLPYTSTFFYHDGVSKNRHGEFLCKRKDIKNLEETKNHIRSLRVHNKFAI